MLSRAGAYFRPLRDPYAFNGTCQELVAINFLLGKCALCNGSMHFQKQRILETSAPEPQWQGAAMRLPPQWARRPSFESFPFH